jgi:cytochrome c-type biogenesis protein CcmF
VASVHAFAGGEIGPRFQYFMFGIAAVSIFLFAYRIRQLWGTQGIESLLSREAAFFFNNLILLSIAGIVFFLSFFDKINHDWFHRKVTQQGLFNIVVTPFFAVLLLLTAAGPGLGWVKTTLRRNFLLPFLVTLVYVSGCYALWGYRGILGTASEVLIPRLENQHPTALYPTGLLLGLCFFIVATVTSEFLRGLRSRTSFRKEDLLTAFFNLVFRNNRRYGGYIVHVGLAVLATGIVVSSMFKVKEELTLKVGQSARVGPYVVSAIKSTSTEPRPGEPYQKNEVLFRVTEPESGLLPVAHGETRAEADPGQAGARSIQPPTSGKLVADLLAERRFYPKKGQWISEVSIERRLTEDVYIYYSAQDERGNLSLTVFINPLMLLIYLGWFIMIGGAVFAALPIPGSKVGLSE